MRYLPIALAILALPAHAGSGGPVSVPLTFVPNAGQTDPAVRFQAHSLGGTLFFTPSEVILALPEAGPAGAANNTASASTTVLPAADLSITTGPRPPAISRFPAPSMRGVFAPP